MPQLYNSSHSSVSSFSRHCHLFLGLLIMESIRLVVAWFLIICLSASPAASQTEVKAGYWPSYSLAEYPPSSIKAGLFTHLYYAFADLDASTFEVSVSPANEESASAFTSAVQRTNPAVKTLISIGGGGGSAVRDAFAQMASGGPTRKAFIDSSIAVARRYGFHGLDLDWEYPQTAAEMRNFATLITELKVAVQNEAGGSGGARLLLTAAVYFYQKLFPWQVVTQYPVQTVAATLDWVHVMAYDFHGSWENNTGAPAALYDPDSEISVSSGIESWLGAGLSVKKAVLGMPLFGRTWQLANAGDTGIGAPAVGNGTIDGVLSFSEIQDFIRDRGATEVFDAATVSAYAYAGNVWVGYDNQQSVAGKVQYAKQKNLLGYFFWSVNQDADAVLPQTASDAWRGSSVEKPDLSSDSDHLKFAAIDVSSE